MRDWDKFMVRLPPGFREQIKELAKENGRSMNSEIVQRLKEVLKNEGKLA
ncbi:Arc family DNA-binding protein [Aeromonas jandaei]|uniref:Arc family DNA-binding protein n=1 Tax=Aeromonas jandaei TaxID=650 RepID=A0A7T4DN92_AERJA|nr:Arc family DNA-binding protein [Aeromonas jandaei]QQB19357.1 Arc family DNA-binding protein [Aeromonas jandaei]